MLSYFRPFSTSSAFLATAKKAASPSASVAATKKKPATKKKQASAATKKPKEKTMTQLKKEEKPKRPTYPYLLYNKENWHSVRDATNLKFADIGKEIGRLWNAESPEVKDKFQKQYEAAREQYLKEVDAWKQKYARAPSGYIKFVKSECNSRPRLTSKEGAIEQMKSIAAKWKTLSDEVKAEWKTK